MRKAIAAAALAITGTALAVGWDDPNALFDTSTNAHTTMAVTWRAVDNVQAECEKESRARGNNGFGYSVHACSFWKGDTCTIITRKQTSMHTLGHETRHCFQRNWH